MKQPPANSGEDGVHGQPIKIYPRIRDVPSSYTGCITTWMPTKAGYEVFGVTQVKKGIAVAFWSAVEDQLCEYRDKEPSHPQCPVYESIMRRTMAAGCVDRMMKAGGSVPGCHFE